MLLQGSRTIQEIPILETKDHPLSSFVVTAADISWRFISIYYYGPLKPDSVQTPIRTLDKLLDPLCHPLFMTLCFPCENYRCPPIRQRCYLLFVMY